MTFPIAFTSYCLNVQGTGSNVSSQATVAWSGLSTTSFNLIIGNSGAIYYIAIGYQQWGRTGSISGDTTKTITYPVAYTSAFYSIALVSMDNASDWNTEISGTPSTSSVTIIVRGKQRSNVYWISLGKQQWGKRNGKGSSGEHRGSVSFPIAFNTCVNVIATQINPYNSNENDIFQQIESLSTSSFTYWSQNSSAGCYDGGSYWIAIGY